MHQETSTYTRTDRLPPFLPSLFPMGQALGVEFPSYRLTRIHRLVASGVGGVPLDYLFPGPGPGRTQRVNHASKQINQQYISRLILRVECDRMCPVCCGLCDLSSFWMGISVCCNALPQTPSTLLSPPR